MCVGRTDSGNLKWVIRMTDSCREETIMTKRVTLTHLIKVTWWIQKECFELQWIVSASAPHKDGECCPYMVSKVRAWQRINRRIRFNPTTNKQQDDSRDESCQQIFVSQDILPLNFVLISRTAQHSSMRISRFYGQAANPSACCGLSRAFDKKSKFRNSKRLI